MRTHFRTNRVLANIEKLESRRAFIVGGNSISISSAPFAVALADRYGQFCGGSLIDATHVLTAAHCADSSGIRAIVNRMDLRSNAGEDIPVAGVTIHPRFNPRTLNNDIAVLTLSRPATQGASIRYVKHDTITDPGKSATVVGWGTTRYGGNSSPVLRSVTVPFVSNANANRPSAYNGDVTSNMLAAGTSGKDSCQGDSGGPLFMKNDAGELRQVGIVSWGEDCARPSYPGIYTRVANYYDWINDTIRQRTFDVVSRQAGGRLRIGDHEGIIETEASNPEHEDRDSIFSDWPVTRSNQTICADNDILPADEKQASTWEACVNAILSQAGEWESEISKEVERRPWRFQETPSRSDLSFGDKFAAEDTAKECVMRG